MSKSFSGYGTVIGHGAIINQIFWVGDCLYLKKGKGNYLIINSVYENNSPYVHKAHYREFDIEHNVIIEDCLLSQNELRNKLFGNYFKVKYRKITDKVLKPYYNQFKKLTENAEES